MFDMRTILPPSLEKLYVHAFYDFESESRQDEWAFFEHMFDEPSTFTPKLTWQNVRITRTGHANWAATETCFGEAEAPVEHQDSWMAGLLRGHGPE